MYTSSKLFDGFSCCFRQWKADNTHCKFLHGYAISFEITFQGELDERNWVWDFGGMKRAEETIDGMQPKDWFDYMFDHTVIIAKDDPQKVVFQVMHDKGIIQLRIVDFVGAERFAQYIYEKVNDFVIRETNNRVKVKKVVLKENNKNSATYEY